MSEEICYLCTLPIAVGAPVYVLNASTDPWLVHEACAKDDLTPVDGGEWPDANPFTGGDQ